LTWTKVYFVGSAGTAVDTHRDALPSALPSSVSPALLKLSRPKTVRHTLTPPRVLNSSPRPLTRPESLSTHASGSRASTCFESPPAFDGRARKTDNEKSGSKSIEMKGDRFHAVEDYAVHFVAQSENCCRLLSWLREANEVEGGGMTPIARFRMQLQVSSSLQYTTSNMLCHTVYHL
jgi:hypothetical protein